MRKKIVLATHNDGKTKELAELLSPWGLECMSAKTLNLPEPLETGATFSANALLKARAAAKSGFLALADDSGLCVVALDNAPGIHSARWAGESKDWDGAMIRIHRALENVQNRAAFFICALALVCPDGREACFEGRVDGHIIWPPRGTRGFGYDPIFVPQGQTKTFGEMCATRKNALSHRTRAFTALKMAKIL